MSTQVCLEGMDLCLFIHSGFLEFAPIARHWEYSGNQALTLALIYYSLRAKSGIKKKKVQVIECYERKNQAATRA